MSPAYLHTKLMEACESGNIDDVQYWIDAGVDINFNITRPINALDKAIQIGDIDIVKLLLKNGAIVKEFVLLKAIEKDKNYLEILIPDFNSCKDEKLLEGILLAAINMSDFELAQKAINQGAKVKSLFLYSIIELASTKILKLLIENGLNIHAEKNTILREWIGASEIGGWGKKRVTKYDLLDFIASYYLDKTSSIENFQTLSLSDKSRLFRMGLDSNNFTMMKFAFLIGTNKNEALNSALYRYYANNHESSVSTHSTMFKNNKSEEIDYEIIKYIIDSDIEFEKATISNAVCFKYHTILEALHCSEDLEYGYEMAYKYEDNNLLDYFINRGVSKKAQSVAKMKVSIVKGDMKELHNAINEGASLQELDRSVIVEVINENQVKSLKYIHDSGVVLDLELNELLNNVMHQFKAYDSISYLVEQGFDITNVKNLPIAYKKRYPTLADMWERNFRDIFEYTVYLAKEILPTIDGKEKEMLLGRIAELSTLPYVIKRSQEKVNEH
jgi:hypothetical protein